MRPAWRLCRDLRELCGQEPRVFDDEAPLLRLIDKPADVLMITVHVKNMEKAAGSSMIE